MFFEGFLGFMVSDLLLILFYIPRDGSGAEVRCWVWHLGSVILFCKYSRNADWGAFRMYGLGLSATFFPLRKKGG